MEFPHYWVLLLEQYGRTHIGGDYWRETARGRSQVTSGLTISVCKHLHMKDSHGNWDVHCVVTLNDLWAQPVYQAPGLPRRRMEFPLIFSAAC